LTLKNHNQCSFVLLRGGRFQILLLQLLISAIFLSACQDQLKTNNNQQPSPATDAPATVPPPVIKTIARPPGPPSGPSSGTPVGASSFAPTSPKAKKTADSPSNPTTAVLDNQSDGNSAKPSTVEAVQPTVLPTFTSPPEPEASPWDHYWFRRPVPEGKAAWTDKAYPYGNTRGGALRPHHGVEFNVPAGTEVLAAASGQVILAGEDIETVVGPDPGFYGRVVVIQHNFTSGNQPVFSLYGHLSEVLVQPGQEIESGELIALSGASGVADGPHLHFETRVGDNTYESTRNPLLWLYPFPERGVVAGIVSWPGGQVAAEAPITLRRLDAESPFAATTTYAQGSINSDDKWGENFALDDVSSGYYLLTVGSGEDKTEVKLWVYPMQTNFVSIQLGN